MYILNNKALRYIQKIAEHSRRLEDMIYTLHRLQVSVKRLVLSFVRHDRVVGATRIHGRNWYHHLVVGGALLGM